jgi:hypothetical protein
MWDSPRSATHVTRLSKREKKSKLKEESSLFSTSEIPVAN